MSGAPPPYNPGYAQQPPQQGYGQPPPQGYAPQQGYPAASYPAQQQQTNQTVVVTQAPAAVTTHYVVKKETNHILHFIICLFCPWWIFVWICACIINS
ncbi:protein SPEC3-like [Halichondria panicea]|uniref:protein SPEC3-like n=1 Tax=Halichondria panicea TaxID=6063 RepID=UPI00312B4C94